MRETRPDIYKKAMAEIDEWQDKFYNSYDEMIKGCRRKLGV